MPGEMLDVVDNDDMIIGKATYEEVHEKKLTHRIVHVFVLNNNRQVYLQKRSETRSYMPGAWCTSAGGHVRSGESYEQAAKRELEEELGIKADKLIPVGKRFIFRLEGQDRLICLFGIITSSPPKPDGSEVSRGEFFDIDKARQLLNSNREKIHPQLPPCFDLLVKNLGAI